MLFLFLPCYSLIKEKNIQNRNNKIYNKESEYK